MLPIAPRPKEQIETELSVIAWELGASYLYRWYMRCHDYTDLFGNPYTFDDGQPLVDDSAVDVADYLPDARTWGAWVWKFNVSWKRGIVIPRQFRSQKRDPFFENDGSRSVPFPGWNNTHPWLTSDEIGDGFESHYFFIKPKYYRKNTDVLPKGLK